MLYCSVYSHILGIWPLYGEKINSCNHKVLKYGSVKFSFWMRRGKGIKPLKVIMSSSLGSQPKV